MKTYTSDEMVRARPIRVVPTVDASSRLAHSLGRLARWIALAALLAGCTDEENTVRTLRASGFTDITTTGWNAFACSDSDTFHTGFRAKNSNGQRVEGTVCCGLMKACTVRF